MATPRTSDMQDLVEAIERSRDVIRLEAKRRAWLAFKHALINGQVVLPRLSRMRDELARPYRMRGASPRIVLLDEINDQMRGALDLLRVPPGASGIGPKP